MCGRYAHHSKPSRITTRLGIGAPPIHWTPRYNISPGTLITGIRHDEDQDEPVFDQLWWRYHPRWADALAPSPTNAQAEHMESSRYFRSAFHHHRCLIPADGWYEWQIRIGGKQPYYISRQDKETLFMAGIYELMKDGSHGCAIITMPSPGSLKDIHPRIPLLLDDESLSAWLDPGLRNKESIQAAVKAADPGALVYWPVSTRVNRTANDRPDLIESIHPED